jgi:thiamine biosynthesis protein ThiS
MEINERIVPRRDLAACMLHDGDRIEIVTLVGGG